MYGRVVVSSSICGVLLAALSIYLWVNPFFLTALVIASSSSLCLSVSRRDLCISVLSTPLSWARCWMRRRVEVLLACVLVSYMSYSGIWRRNRAPYIWRRYGNRLKIQGKTMNTIRFAENIEIVAENAKDLKSTTKKIHFVLWTLFLQLLCRI